MQLSRPAGKALQRRIAYERIMESGVSPHYRLVQLDAER